MYDLKDAMVILSFVLWNSLSFFPVPLSFVAGGLERTVELGSVALLSLFSFGAGGWNGGRYQKGHSRTGTMRDVTIPRGCFLLLDRRCRIFKFCVFSPG